MWRRSAPPSSGDFSHELLAAAVPFAEAELQEALRCLVDAGLVFQRGVPPAAEYLFKHALVQDTAYSTLWRGPRQALHRRIAEAAGVTATALEHAANFLSFAQSQPSSGSLLVGHRILAQSLINSGD
jgi:hypothetical protein